MNKLRFIFLSIPMLIFVNTLTHSEPSHFLFSKSEYSFLVFDLSKKSYYKEIFTKDQLKKLKKADKYKVAAKKYMAQYDSYQAQIEKLYTIAEATSSAKNRQKSLKKARKLESKARKRGFKAINYYKKAFDIRSKIYITALNRVRLNDDSKNSKLGREIELQAKAIFESAQTKERTAPQHDEQLKFNVLREATDMSLKAFAMQETAFGFYKNDSTVSAENYNIEDNTSIKDSNQVVKVDSVLFPVYVEQYNPLTDPNLYRSRANIILPRLNLTNQDLNTIVDANRKNQYANGLLKQVDQAYMVVDSLNFIADRTEDFYERDKIRNNAISKEQSAFYKLTNATNIYLNVNEIRYNIYKKHYPKIEAGKRNANTARALRYQTEAEDYYLKAKGEIVRANKLMYRSDQYLKLMGANDILLYAIQLQESAYGIYLNMPEVISAEIDTSFVTENKYNNSNVSTNKENTSSSLSWNFLSSYTYSKEKPKPVRYKAKKGVIFTIQLGIFKGLLPSGKFGSIQPIIFDKFVKNPYRRYMVGEYRTWQAAELALQKIKNLGYSDAYIISKDNGARKTLAYGKAKIDPAIGSYSEWKRIEIAKINGAHYNKNANISTNISKDGYVSGNDVKNTSGLVYLVQLGMYLKPITYDQLANLQPIYTEKVPNKGTRYMFGTFSTISEARQQSNAAINKGLKDAYVTAYYNGKHISLQKAKSYEKKQNGTVVTNYQVKSSGAILFMVQIGAYRERLSEMEENKLEMLFSPRKVVKRYSNGMNVYTLGDYKNYKEADYLKKKLIGEGHKDVFVVAFEGTQKIAVGDAIKKSKR